jgi:streptogramin lyase
LYICDSINYTIRKLEIATQAVTTIAGSAGQTGSANGVGSAARFFNPTGITYDGQGNLYITDAGNSIIRKLEIVSGLVSTIAGTAGSTGSADGVGSAARFYYPYGIVYVSDNLYICDGFNSIIRKLEISSGQVSTIAGPAASFFVPYGITYDGQGNLFITDSYNHTIRKLVISSGLVTTIAGTAGSFGSADGVGSSARFYYPYGITYIQGYLYICDSNNRTIRKLVISSGQVITFAGSEQSPVSNDGVGSFALFNNPRGIVYIQDHLYICDSDNNTIRKLMIASGEVTTIAGSAGSAGSADGIGSAARFNKPYGITYDGQGNLYITDGENNTIRKLVISTAAVTTIAGTAGSFGSADGVGSSARFFNPRGITYDETGNLYICDEYFSIIRRLVIASGQVTTIAGTAGSSGSADGVGSSARFNNPTGIVYFKGNLYICDTNNDTIRKLAIATNSVTTIAGLAGSFGSADGVGSAARFFIPNGITYDGQGNLFIASALTIQKLVIATNSVTTIAGLAFNSGSADGIGSTARFFGLNGITYDGKGNLFACDSSNCTIRKIIL